MINTPVWNTTNRLQVISMMMMMVASHN